MTARPPSGGVHRTSIHSFSPQFPDTLANQGERTGGVHLPTRSQIKVRSKVGCTTHRAAINSWRLTTSRAIFLSFPATSANQRARSGGCTTREASIAA